MSATAFNLAAALASLGVARAFMGDPLTANGMIALPTQGEITTATPQNLNRLTAPEFTGDVAHDAWVTPGQTTVTIPIIYGGGVTLSELSALGTAGDGFSSPKRPTYTSLLIIPLAEMSTADPPTISYEIVAPATTPSWSPAAPVEALWFWKCVPQRPDMRFAWDDGGKIILPVTFEVFYDATKPSGQRIFTQGDPAAQGITTLRI